jgi:chemotaxis protein MotB
MPIAARIALCCLLGTLTFSQTGCNLVPRQQLAMSQHRTRQLWEQNKSLAMEREQMARTMAENNQRLSQQNADLQASRDALQKRVDNLLAERGSIKTRLTGSSPLSENTTRQFEGLARKYPGFQFDPQTGVSKFSSDIFFESGTAEIRAEKQAILRDFAAVLNKGDAKQLNILIVGHTDDMRVVKEETKRRHPDNWYLSAHRAIGVRELLHRFGLREGRMGVAGYGPYQPVATGADSNSRSKNRRVEIYVLAPNASMAGMDTRTPR